MISVLPEKNKDKIKEIFGENGLSYNEKSGGVFATLGSEVLGYCLYYLDDKSMTVLKLYPQDDLMLADGILRSALHISAEHFVMDARYSEEMDETVFARLCFIKDRKNRTLDIDKLFGGCSCAEK